MECGGKKESDALSGLVATPLWLPRGAGGPAGSRFFLPSDQAYTHRATCLGSLASL